MPDGISGSDRRTELVDVIRRVRNRWRLRLALRGAVIVVAGTLLALLLSASSLEALRFSPAAIIAFRLIAFLVFGGLAYIGLVRPLRRRVTDSRWRCTSRNATRRCRPPSSARSKRRRRSTTRPTTGPSPRLVERLVEQAIEQCRAIEDGMAIERPKLRRQALTLGAVVARRGAARRVRAGLPAPRPVGAAHRLAQRRSGEPVPHRRQPGNTKFRAARDQTVKAKLVGFMSAEATPDDAHRCRARRSSACRSSPAQGRRRRSKACSSTSRSRPSTTSSRTA